MIVLALLLVLALLTISQEIPGIEVGIPLSTLATVAKSIIPSLEKKFPLVEFPDITTEFNTPIGTVEFTLSGLQIESIDLSIPTFNVSSDNSVTIEVSSLSAALHASWSYREEHGIHIKDHGTMDISAFASTRLVIGLQNFSPTEEHPCGILIVEKGLNIIFSKFTISLHGGKSWLYNLVIQHVKSKIENTIQQNAQKELTTLLIPLIQKKIDDNVNLPLPFEGLTMKMIIENLIISEQNQNIFFGINGEIEKNGYPSYPGPPSRLPESISNKQMMNLYVSSYVPNSLFYVLNQLNLFQIVVSQKLIPPTYPLELNTTFFREMLPELYDKYPDKAIEIKISLSPDLLSPHVDMNQNNIFATVHLNTEFDVILESPTPVFTIDTLIEVNVSLSLVPTSYGFGIQVQILFLEDLNMTLIHSEIGSFDCSGLAGTIETVIMLFGMKTANKYFRQHPFQIPSISQDIEIMNPNLKINDGYGEIHFDFLPNITNLMR